MPLDPPHEGRENQIYEARDEAEVNRSRMRETKNKSSSELLMAMATLVAMASNQNAMASNLICLHDGICSKQWQNTADVPNDENCGWKSSATHHACDVAVLHHGREAHHVFTSSGGVREPSAWE